jgi:hypothetical protein
MANPRDELAEVVRTAWVAAVQELVPDAKASWLKPWADLDPDDPVEAFQIEADRRIGQAVEDAVYARVRAAVRLL